MEKLWIDSCSLEELGRLSGATVRGTADPIRALAPIGAAGPGDLTLLANRRYSREARSSPASAILTSDALAGQLGDRPLLVAPNPLLGFVTLMRHFAPQQQAGPGWGDATTLLDSTTMFDPSAVAAPGAFVGPGGRIGAHTTIGPMAVVEADVIVGSHCTIGPGAFIGRGCRIEDHVIVHPGAVVGSDGFGYVFDGVAHLKIPQLGNVVVERDAEIGANATIDRATLGTTRIGRGTKIDNQVQIAHNVQVGQLCVVAAQTGIAGSARLGDRCTLGGQVGVADHVFVGERVVAAARTGFSRDVAEGTWAGVPAQPIERWRRTVATLDWLVDVRRQIVKLLRLDREKREPD